MKSGFLVFGLFARVVGFYCILTVCLQDAVSTIINISDVAIGAVVSIYFYFGAGSARVDWIALFSSVSVLGLIIFCEGLPWGDLSCLLCRSALLSFWFRFSVGILGLGLH